MVKKMATEKLDANNDLVKMLNSLGARAAAFTIRDKQVSPAKAQGGGGKEGAVGGTNIMHGCSLKTIEPRIPKIPEWSTSGFH